MADFPAMPLFTDAYLADTRHLSTLEHGAYLLLLMEAWRRPTCSLPNDPALLARLAGITVEEWEQASPVILEFWIEIKGGKEIAQKRLKKEREFVASRSKKNREIAVNRWKDTKNIGTKTDAKEVPKSYENDAPTPTPTYKEKNTLTGIIKAPKKSSGSDLFKSILSEHMNENILDDFCAHRKSRKAPLSETAARMFLKAASDCGISAGQAAAIAIERNWLTVKPDWLNKNGSRPEKMTIGSAAAQAPRSRDFERQQDDGLFKISDDRSNSRLSRLSRGASE